MSLPPLIFPRHAETGGTPVKIGLALSSGGARGLAHIGVIQVLEESGIKIDAVAGSSMGAYVGALWAAGCDGAQLEALAAEIGSPLDFLSRLDMALPPFQGLVHGRKIRDHLARDIGWADFAELEREFYTVAVNLDTHQRAIFHKGDVADAVHASLAIPGLCVPVEIGGQRFCDGGVVDPLPCGVLIEAGCDFVIAVNVIPSFAEVDRGLERRRPGARGLSRWNPFATGNMMDVLRRSVWSAQIRLAHLTERRADVIIHPSLAGSRLHDFHHWARYIELGRTAALQVLPDLLSLMQNPTPHSHENHRSPFLVGHRQS